MAAVQATVCMFCGLLMRTGDLPLSHGVCCDCHEAWMDVIEMQDEEAENAERRDDE